MFASSRVRTISSSRQLLTIPSARTALTTSSTSGQHGLLERRRGGDDPVACRDPLAPGRRRSSQASLCTRAAISAPTPPVSVPSSTVTSEPVRPTDSSTGSRSSGSSRPRRDDLREELVLDDQPDRGLEHDRQHAAVRDDRRSPPGEAVAGERERRVVALRLDARELAEPSRSPGGGSGGRTSACSR